MRVSYLLMSGMTALLTACGGGSVKETLGINHKAPDEYRVVSRPPLSVPPQFNLRAPLKAGDEEVTRASSKQAESLLLGKAQAESSTFTLPAATSDTAVMPVDVAPLQNKNKPSTPEVNFLQRAGATDAAPDIRQTLEEDALAQAPIDEETSWWDVFSTLPPKKDPLVDAAGESERLKKNKEEGKPVTEGETPEVKQRDRGVLGRILGD